MEGGWREKGKERSLTGQWKPGWDLSSKPLPHKFAQRRHLSILITPACSAYLTWGVICHQRSSDDRGWMRYGGEKGLEEDFSMFSSQIRVF